MSVLKKIRAEIEKCLEALEAIKLFKLQILSEDAIEERKLTYQQCLGFIDKYAEQDPYYFARWVATVIFDDTREYNKDAFAELACRKLAKLGIVRAKGNEWELVEPQESEDEDVG